MRRLTVVAAWLCGCGDNLLGDGVPLVASHDLVIVAHQDDDLLFMQPDVIEAVQHGAGVTHVYVTAGNATHGADVAATRDLGLMQAYGQLVGDTAWNCGYIEMLDHLAEHCRLASANLSLVFLAYPDGGKEGQLDSSLLHLWEGTIDRATTVADRTASYNRDELVAVVAEIIDETKPAVVRTLEIAATHGRDHSDHMIVGALSLLALAQTTSDAALISYRGYDTAAEPANKQGAILDLARTVVARYEACANDCAACGETCTTIDPTHEIWLQRRYAVGFRPAATGALEVDGQCLDRFNTDEVRFGDCASATVWRFHAGKLEADGGCLEALANGALAVGACAGGAAQRFFADDEDHIWSGVAPDPQPGLDFDHLRCLTPAGDRAGALLCGRESAPTWHITPPLVATPRAGLGLAATGRAVRLGDLTGDGRADLCAVEGGVLWCAPGDGTGAFRSAIRIDHDASPLAIDPNSLTLGDVDGDQRPDACGRDAQGVLCALSSRAFLVARFTPMFGDADANAGTSPSLTAVDANDDGTAELCGLATEGVVCAPEGPVAKPIVLSTWPATSAIVWPADLDGDHRADWCSTSTAGPACGVEAESQLTRDGVPWGFAQNGVVEDVPLDPAITGAADIDGDGRADLCIIEGVRVACARSQGRGFGPRTTFAVIPAGATALWLGDLDGDGRADACVDIDATITCARAR